MFFLDSIALSQYTRGTPTLQLELNQKPDGTLSLRSRYPQVEYSMYYNDRYNTAKPNDNVWEERWRIVNADRERPVKDLGTFLDLYKLLDQVANTFPSKQADVQPILELLNEHGKKLAGTLHQEAKTQLKRLQEGMGLAHQHGVDKLREQASDLEKLIHRITGVKEKP